MVSDWRTFCCFGRRRTGSHFSGPVQDFPICVPVGSQAPHAAGVAYAFKLRREPRVAVCMFGDGATSKGDVYEAMNFAGVHKLPVVFVTTNNQWAISVPLRQQTAAETLAQKAIAAGFIGEQVDGNDVVASRLFEAGNFRAAKLAYEDILIGRPGDPVARLMQGEIEEKLFGSAPKVAGSTHLVPQL